MSEPKGSKSKRGHIIDLAPRGKKRWCEELGCTTAELLLAVKMTRSLNPDEVQAFLLKRRREAA